MSTAEISRVVEEIVGWLLAVDLLTEPKPYGPFDAASAGASGHRRVVRGFLAER